MTQTHYQHTTAQDSTVEKIRKLWEFIIFNKYSLIPKSLLQGLFIWVFKPMENRAAHKHRNFHQTCKLNCIFITVWSCISYWFFKIRIGTGIVEIVFRFSDLKILLFIDWQEFPSVQSLHLYYRPIQSVYSPSTEIDKFGGVFCTLKNSREFGNPQWIDQRNMDLCLILHAVGWASRCTSSSFESTHGVVCNSSFSWFALG